MTTNNVRTRLADSVLGGMTPDSQTLSGAYKFVAPAIVTLCTQTEIYIDRVIAHLAAKSSINDTPLGSLLLKEFGRDFNRTWRDRFKWLALGFNIDLRGQAPAQEMESLIDLRNAIAHGGGALSQNQRKMTLSNQLELERNLRRIFDVSVIAQRLHFSETTHDLCRKVARAYISAIDELLVSTDGTDLA